MKNIFTVFLIGCCLLITGCSSAAAVRIDPSSTPPGKTATFTPSPTATASLTPQPTGTATATLVPSPTLSPTPTLTPTWLPLKAGKVTAPILLYHHVDDTQPDTRYYMTLAAFTQQMQALHDWGYTPVTVSMIASVVIKGGDLPARPVAITFDDGDEDVYTNAFPIMQKFGYIGTFYIVDKYLDAPQYVTTPQVKEMIAAGWEIGSHSMTHLDLSKAHDKVQYEMGTSKSTLEKALQTKITSFAYPFGTIDPYLVSKVQNYGYQSAVGLGSTYVHSMASIYYLSRMEIQGTYDMATFASMLPWHDVPNP